VVSLINPLLDTDIHNVNRFVAFLEATYSNLNKEITALSKLNNLKQGKRSFTTYFTKFSRLAANIGLNKISLIASLCYLLSLKL
jgi:predicted ATPase